MKTIQNILIVIVTILLILIIKGIVLDYSLKNIGDKISETNARVIYIYEYCLE